MIWNTITGLALTALIFLVLHANVTPWARHWTRRFTLITWNSQEETP